MPDNIKNTWTWQGIAQLLAIVVTLATIVGLAYNEGREREALTRRVLALETMASQSQMDSRTLLELKTDFNHVRADVSDIKRIVLDLRTVAVSGNISCPDTRPVLVASYCRSLPVSSSSPGQ